MQGAPAQALAAEAPAGGSLPVRRWGGSPGLGVQVSPLGPWQAELGGRRVSAFLAEGLSVHDIALSTG